MARDSATHRSSPPHATRLHRSPTSPAPATPVPAAPPLQHQPPTAARRRAHAVTGVLEQPAPCSSIARQRTSSCAASAARILSASASHRRVDPSISVNKNVTTPEGGRPGDTCTGCHTSPRQRCQPKRTFETLVSGLFRDMVGQDRQARLGQHITTACQKPSHSRYPNGPGGSLHRSHVGGEAE